MNLNLKYWLLSIAFLISGCTGVPDGVTPVSDLDLERYLGKWYEIARLDHSFERGLSHVTATYSKREDGGIKVINRGYDSQKKEWKEAVGKAYAVAETTIGRLKVSFFGPFYGGYNILALDTENYRYSLVSGPTRSYLWILSRTPVMEPGVLERLVQLANQLGFDTSQLIYVDHTGEVALNSRTDG